MITACNLCENIAIAFYEAYSQINKCNIYFCYCKEHNVYVSSSGSHGYPFRNISQEEYLTAKVLEL